MGDIKILVAIFHKPGANDSNFEVLKTLFNEFDTFIPEVDYYGNKWRETKELMKKGEYDSLFLICSDVSVICGDIISKIKEYAPYRTIGVYGFGTIGWCTFTWLHYNSLQKVIDVPF